MKTPSANELLVQITREAEQRKLLLIALECKTLDELIEKLREMLNK